LRSSARNFGSTRPASRRQSFTPARAGDPAYKDQLARLRDFIKQKMAELKDEFKPCSWYRDNWMYKKFSIQAAAKGKFGSLPPIEPKR